MFCSITNIRYPVCALQVHDLTTDALYQQLAELMKLGAATISLPMPAPVPVAKGHQLDHDLLLAIMHQHGYANGPNFEHQCLILGPSWFRSVRYMFAGFDGQHALSHTLII